MQQHRVGWCIAVAVLVGAGCNDKLSVVSLGREGHQQALAGVVTDHRGDTYFVVDDSDLHLLAKPARAPDYGRVACKLANAALTCRDLGIDHSILLSPVGDAEPMLASDDGETIVFHDVLSGHESRAAVPSADSLPLHGGVVFADGTVIGCFPDSLWRFPPRGAAQRLADADECKTAGDTAVWWVSESDVTSHVVVAELDAAGVVKSHEIAVDSRWAQPISVCSTAESVGLVHRTQSGFETGLVRVDRRTGVTSRRSLVGFLDGDLSCRGPVVTALHTDATSERLLGERCDPIGCRHISFDARADLYRSRGGLLDSGIVFVGIHVSDDGDSLEVVTSVDTTPRVRWFAMGEYQLLDVAAMESIPGGALVMGRQGPVVLDSRGAPVRLSLRWVGAPPAAAPP